MERRAKEEEDHAARGGERKVNRIIAHAKGDTKEITNEGTREVASASDERWDDTSDGEWERKSWNVSVFGDISKFGDVSKPRVVTSHVEWCVSIDLS